MGEIDTIVFNGNQYSVKDLNANAINALVKLSTIENKLKVMGDERDTYAAAHAYFKLQAIEYTKDAPIMVSPEPDKT